MPGVERVPVPVDYPVPSGRTNAYVVDDVLVDPAARCARLDDLDGVAHVVATHTHADHVDALAHYTERTGATVWAYAPYAERFADATGVTPDRTYREGDAIGPLDVVATPGHAPDHVAFAVGDTYLVGDCARAGGSVAITDEGDLRASLTSLRRLYARAPDRLYPGHGEPIRRPRERLAEIVAHRRERDRDVLAAVAAGAGSVPEVVDAVYERDLGDYRGLAAATVRAHLEKLVVEDRVTRETTRDGVRYRE
ncbi:glyoxylase-like metal-dependent hydrolase (beta-lactamase superfamily II) [Halarchaeum rubridurum]|uniref:Glyoxylase-like metal-dependent hydrolase (Beta-lactamase superfamily II) n=1 Tax=Halarchaeum rubridurum TaxID=489911 RepID=A0A830FZT2_9EURY|nr:MBL fold metallo-hydrolase [Halarchaeum rubridurum]MBP1955190.1 glyoxylase-like metal-dependent hydrolase (beta-lactamase superfamily II) [Halarchaeum rubridurum]GGM68252.1 MBL fold hydrolase [Halarchaeum rubridurum]